MYESLVPIITNLFDESDIKRTGVEKARAKNGGPTKPTGLPKGGFRNGNSFIRIQGTTVEFAGSLITSFFVQRMFAQFVGADTGLKGLEGARGQRLHPTGQWSEILLKLTKLGHVHIQCYS